MGIPSYFSYLVKNHPTIIKKFTPQLFPIHNLYLDCNSIIYDIYHTTSWDNLNEHITVQIITLVIAKIEEYISIIKPTNTVIIAFDGVAPVAKLEQQRSRRYKSWYQNNMSKHIFKQTKADPWNTTEITPGTIFMNKLNIRISEHFTSQLITKYCVNDIIVSGSNKVGEGEYKLFEYIRKEPLKHEHETTVIYGLDADLIMLSINHIPICPNIYLFRETPSFIQSIDSSLEPNANYFLDIPELSNTIIDLMNNERVLSATVKRNKVYDYIFMCFFLGNDFLPHFPAINIRTGGIDKMINAYKATIGTTDENLTDGRQIFWNNVRILVEFLANNEQDFINTEHQLRTKKELYKMADTTPQEKHNKFELTPVYNREVEKYINPKTAYWQSRYYRAMFAIQNDDDNRQKQAVAVNYLQGLEWNMKYYTSNCPDWRWKYNYHYPPLLQDLIKYIPIFNTTYFPLEIYNPVSDMVQLCYVLPPASLHLLPTHIHTKLIRNYNHWYKGNWEFVWAYCRYFWECHVQMEDININELESVVNNITPTEKKMRPN